MTLASGKAWLPLGPILAVLLTPAAAAKTFNLEGNHVPDQLLVKFAPGLAAPARQKLLAAAGAKVLHTFKSGALQLAIATKGDDKALRSVAQQLAAHNGVVYVEANAILRADATAPNDPDFGKLYGLSNDGSTGGAAGASIHAPEAWDLTTGSKSVVVGIIDTGMDYTHPDLSANLWTNPGETGLDANGHDKATNGIDDDGNGYVDDWHGWDFANNDNDPMDDNNHGTHVAGTIGAHGNDGVGVVGVNWNVAMVPLKFLTSAGTGALADAVKAIEYGTSLGVHILSNSWGGGGYSDTMDAAIQAANAAGILFVAAAGNDGTDNDAFPHYPSSYGEDNIIAVAATDNKDGLAAFSCIGRNTVDVGAPGVDIWSSIPGNKYDKLSGTSMATPHVTGIAALIKAKFPGATAAQIKARILNTADPIPSLTGKTTTGARVNAFNALEEDTVPPNAVSGLSVDGTGTSTVDLSWLPAGDDGAAGTAKRYEVRIAAAPIEGEAAWAAAARAAAAVSAGPASVHAQVSGLAFNTAGYLAVRAVDNVGNVGALARSVAYAVRPIMKLAENAADSLDGVGHEGTWGLEQDAAKGSVFSDSPGTPYDVNVNASLTMAPVTVAGNDVTLMLSTSTDLESNYDFGFIEVSGDGGATWLPVDKLTGTVAWAAKTYNLAGILGAKTTSVVVRFRMTSDYSIGKDGWKLDDVALYGAAPAG